MELENNSISIYGLFHFFHPIKLWVVSLSSNFLMDNQQQEPCMYVYGPNFFSENYINAL